MQFSIKAGKKLRLLILFLFSTSAFATRGHIYLGGTIGAINAIIANSNPTIHYYDDNLMDAYPIYDRHANTEIIGLNGGYEIIGTGYIPAVALGLGIYGTPRNAVYRGQVIETATGDPSSKLYNYKYKMNSTRLMLEAQFTWMLWEQFDPFINVGIGAARNRLSDYTESSVDNPSCNALPPPFQSNTSINFAAQAGLGVSYAFNFKHFGSNNLHERISIGYRYVILGNTSFGTRGAVYPYKLDTGRLFNNELYLSYTYLF